MREVAVMEYLLMCLAAVVILHNLVMGDSSKPHSKMQWISLVSHTAVYYQQEFNNFL